MKYFKYSFLLIIQLCYFKNLAQSFTVSGYITDSKNGESLIGVTVNCFSEKKGAVSNGYGYYALTLPKGNYEIVFTYLGFVPEKRKIRLDSNISLNIRMNESTNDVKEVTVKASDQKGRLQV